MATAATSILEFFEKSGYHDVTFKVKCGSRWCYFNSQKLVLSIWSPVLAEKFRYNKNDFDEEIEILDIRPSAIQAFLNYLSGSTKELELSKNDVKFVFEVYRAACRYQVQRLKTHCCEILISATPNESNVFELVDVAHAINSNSLRGRCFNILQSTTDTILNSRDIESVTTTMVFTLLQLPSLWLSSEYELITWVFKWAKSYFSILGIDNPRDLLSNFLPYLNFTALKSDEFAIIVSNYKEFLDEGDCFKIFMNINLPGSTELPVWYDASTNSRQYEKPKQTAENDSISDSAPDSINNLTSSNLDSNKQTESNSYSGDQPTITNPKANNHVDAATITDAYSNNYVDTATIIDPKDNNYVDAATITDSKANNHVDAATITDSKANNHVDATTITDQISDDCSLSTVNICFTALQQGTDTWTQTDEEVETKNKEIISQNESVSLLSADKVDDQATDSKHDAIPSIDLPSADKTDYLTMDTNDERATSPRENSFVIIEDETSSIIESTERGQKNSEVLKTIDQEPGESFDTLEPPMHLEKIKKKKIMKTYLLPEGKSLPNIGAWDPVLESPFLCGDFKSLSDIIEKQQCLPAVTARTKLYGF